MTRDFGRSCGAAFADPPDACVSPVSPGWGVWESLPKIRPGVHIFRVLKREYAGLTPLDEKTQLLIRNKLRGDIYEREYKRIVRELKARSTIEIERD